MMARFLASFLLLFASLGVLATAQDDDLDKLQFDEVPVSQPSNDYFGVGGGYIANAQLLNLTEVNKLVTGFGLKELSGTMFMSGASGVASIGLIRNVRVGIFTMGGTVTSSGSAVDAVHGNVERRIDLSLGRTGLGVEYGRKLFTGFTAFAGVYGGWGEMSIESFQKKSPRSFQQSIGATPPGGTYATRLVSGYSFVQPTLNLEYNPTELLMIRAGASYNAAFMGDWKSDELTTVSDVPSAVNANGVTFTLGFCVGLFSR